MRWRLTVGMSVNVLAIGVAVLFGDNYFGIGLGPFVFVLQWSPA